MFCPFRHWLRVTAHLCVLLFLFASAPAFAGTPPHILVVLMENAGYDSVIGSSDYPFVNQLAGRYALATNYYAVAHPSEPNYLALISGSTHGITDDNYHPLSGQTLADQLSAAGISWRAYMEDVNLSDITSGTGEYAVKHDPFASFTSILNNPAKRANVVPYDQLGNDLANANGPSFMWVTPNLIDDAHDGTPQDGENFLKGLIDQVTRSAWWGNGSNAAIIITWDEGDDSDSSGIGTASSGGGHVATLVIGPAGHRQLASPVNHYGLLRSLEKVYGLSYLNDAADSSNGDLTPLLPAGNVPAPGSSLTSPGTPSSGRANRPPIPGFAVEHVVAGHWLSIPVTLRTPDGRTVVRLRLQQLQGPATATWLNGSHLLLRAPSVPATLIFRLTLIWNTGARSQMNFAVAVQPAPANAPRPIPSPQATPPAPYRQNAGSSQNGDNQQSADTQQNTDHQQNAGDNQDGNNQDSGSSQDSDDN